MKTSTYRTNLISSPDFHSSDYSSAAVVYLLGDIPDLLVVGPDQQLRFQIRPKDGDGQIVMEQVESTFQTAVKWDENATFEYDPKLLAGRSFKVTFTDKSRGNTQTITIRSLSREYHLIQRMAPMPNKSASALQRISVIEAEEKKNFNGRETIKTRSVMIRGVKIVLADKGSPEEQELWKKACIGDSNIATFSLYADEVIIRSKIELPQTDVRIHARYLLFEENGCIDTTPCAHTGRAEDTENGLPGAKAGDILLWVDELVCPEKGHRFVLNGSQGQAAGNGKSPDPTGRNNRMDTVDLDKHASDEVDRNNRATLGRWLPVISHQDLNTLKDHATYVEVWQMKDFDAIENFSRRHRFFTPRLPKDWPPEKAPTDSGSNEWRDWARNYDRNRLPTDWHEQRTCEFYLRGELKRKLTYGKRDVWPQDGINGHPPGKPGNGGNGGVLYSSINGLDHLVLANGASNGGIGAPAASLPPQEPRKAKRARIFVSMDVTGRRSEDFGLSSEKPTAWVQYFDENEGKDAPAVPKSESGVPSQKGGVEHRMRHWIHPEIVRAVMSYARELWMNGHEAAAASWLHRYEKLIEVGQKDAELTDNERLDLSSLRIEMLGYLDRIQSHLDYFGYPAGWYPRISFENLAMNFDTEREFALRTMFLAYWIERGRQNRDALLLRLGEAREKLFTEARMAQAEVTVLTQSLPSLEEKIIKLKGELEQLEEELKGLTDRLLREAKQYLLAERKRKAHIHLVSGLLSTALQVVPVGQPLLGAAGSLLVNLATCDARGETAEEAFFASQGKLYKAMSQYGESKLLEKAKKLTLDAEIDEGKHAYGPESVEEAQARKKKGKAELYTTIGNELVSATSEFIKSIEPLKASATELEAKLEEVKNSSPDFKDLAEKILKLKKTQTDVFEQLTRNRIALEKACATLAQSSLGAEALTRQLQDKQATLDSSVLAAICGLKERAINRLNRYQYYMAKAYEHRMLDSCDAVDYHLDELISKMTSMLEEAASKSESNNGLPSQRALIKSEDFKLLDTLYQEILHKTRGKIIDDFNAKGGQIDREISYSLSAEELDRLKKDGRITLNLMDAGIVSLDEENIRLLDARIHDDEGKPIGFYFRGSCESVVIKFHHLGRAVIRKNGRLFFFDSSTDGGNDISWQSTYLDSTKKLAHNRLSRPTESLLRYLFGDTPDPSAHFAQPGAWTDLEISCEPSKESQDFRIERLELCFKISAASAGSIKDPEYALDVRGVGGLNPFISCSEMDQNGARDGCSDFVRIYKKNTTMVELVAPKEWEGRRFLRWSVRNMRDRNYEDSKSASPMLQLPMNASWRVYLHYDNAFRKNWSLSKKQLFEHDCAHDTGGARLELRRTYLFQKIGDDSGSSAWSNVSIYKPKVPKGWSWLGHVAVPGHTKEPDAALILKDLTPGAVAPPKGFIRVWSKGTSYTCWRIEAPPGFRALGCIMRMNKTGPDMPLPEEIEGVVCVHQDLVADAEIDGGSIWTNKLSGTSTKCSLWRVRPKSGADVLTGTVYAFGAHQVPQDAQLLTLKRTSRGNVLRAGSSLRAEQCLSSANGLYHFVFQTDGNAVLFHGNNIRWQSKTSGKVEGGQMTLTMSGLLVIHDASNKEIWRAPEPYVGQRLELRDDGVLAMCQYDQETDLRTLPR